MASVSSRIAVQPVPANFPMRKAMRYGKKRRQYMTENDVEFWCALAKYYQGHEADIVSYIRSTKRLDATSRAAIAVLLEEATQSKRVQGRPQGHHTKFRNPNYWAAFFVAHVCGPAWKRENGKANVPDKVLREVLVPRAVDILLRSGLIEAKHKVLENEVVRILRLPKKQQLAALLVPPPDWLVGEVDKNR